MFEGLGRRCETTAAGAVLVAVLAPASPPAGVVVAITAGAGATSTVVGAEGVVNEKSLRADALEVPGGVPVVFARAAPEV